MTAISRKKKALYTAIFIFILLASAEAALRLINFNFYYNFGADLLGMPLLELHSIRRHMNKTVDFDPHLFWRFKPNQKFTRRDIYKKDVTINSHGFRGRDFTEEKPEGTFRVACLGDSTTFGWSVGDDETFAHFLEKILAADCPGKKVEVINLGVTGYTSLQGRELMKRYAVKWRPDLVIFAFGPNDRLPALYSDEEQIERGAWSRTRAGAHFMDFQLYKLVYSGVVYVKNLFLGLSLDPKTYIPRLKRKVSPEEFARNAQTVKKLCDEIGADFILVHVDYPSLPPDHVSRDLAEEANKAGGEMPSSWRAWTLPADLLNTSLPAPIFELRPFFQMKLDDIASGKLDPERASRLRASDPLIANEPWRLIMVDNGHPNAWGHELIAAELAGLAVALPRFRAFCPGTSQ